MNNQKLFFAGTMRATATFLPLAFLSISLLLFASGRDSGAVEAANPDDPNLGAEIGPHAALAEITQSQKFLPNAEWNQVGQGQSVDISGDSAIIGIPIGSFAASASGGAMVVTRAGSTWSKQGMLLPLSAAAGDNFGQTVAIDGDVAVVASRTTGKVVIFERTGTAWTEADSISLGSGLIESIDLDGNTLAIGRPGFGNGSGIVSLYVNNSQAWVAEGSVSGSDTTTGHAFGGAVALDGETLLVGAVGLSSNAGAAYLFTRSNTVWSEQVKFVAGDAAANNRFGDAVALHNNTAVIGAPGTDGSGRVYIFANSVANPNRAVAAWSQQAKIGPSDGVNGDQFGYAVAVHNGTVLVGAWLSDDQGNNSGSAYLFTRSVTSWSQQTEITAADTGADNLFGTSVALESGTAIVGALWGTGQTSASGSVYAFTGSGSSWSEQAELIPDNWGAGQNFGNSIAMFDENTILIGAVNGDGRAEGSGAVYVYRKLNSGWRFFQKITGSDSGSGDRFGRFIVISGDTALIGADRHGNEAGAVYVFKRGTNTAWTEEGKLQPSDIAAGDRFGYAGAVDGNTAIFGAPWEGGTGSAYIFSRGGSGWSEQSKLTATSASNGDNVGWSVALDGDWAVVGAPYDDTHGTNSGAIHLFTQSGNSWSFAQKLTRNAGGIFYGRTLGIAGDTLLVGAPFAGTNGSGRVHIYGESGGSWTYESSLGADFVNGDLFGWHLNLSPSGEIALVTVANEDLPAATDAGVVQVYYKGANGWIAADTLVASDPVATDQLGHTTAFINETLFVGGERRDENGTDAGAVYRYELPQPTRLIVTTGSAALNEGDSGTTPFTFAVSRTGPTIDPLTINYTVLGSGSSPADSADFGGGFPSGVVTLSAGQSGRNFTVSVSGDYQAENDETFTLSISTTAAALIDQPSVSATILNDDTAGLDIDLGGGLAVFEGGATDSLAVQLTSRPTAAVVVGLDPDNQLNLGAGAGAVQILNFDSSNWDVAQTVTVSAVNDLIDERTHSGTITIGVASSDPFYSGLADSSETVTIYDNDILESVAISPITLTEIEGDSGGVDFLYTVTRTGYLTTSLALNYTVSGEGSDPADEADFGGSFPQGTVTFPVGVDSRTVTVTVSGDHVVEPLESFGLNLSLPNSLEGRRVVNPTPDAVGFISNDDAAGVNRDVGDGLVVSEAGQTDQMTITLSSRPVLTVSVTLAPDDQLDLGSGVGLSRTLTFPPSGWNLPQTVTITAADDGVNEGVHTGDITISTSSGDMAYAGLSVPTATVTIADNDAPPGPSGEWVGFSTGFVELDEGDSGTVKFNYVVTRTGEITASRSLSYTVAGSGSFPADEDDFATGVLSGTLTFGAGEAIKTISLDVSGDTEAEPDEAFTVTISATAGVTLTGPSADGLIRNDDAQGFPPGVDISNDGGLMLAEGGMTDTFSINLASPPTTTVIITFDPNNQIDLGNGPGEPVNQRFELVDWQVPRTVTVTAVDDTVVEGAHGGQIAFLVSSGDPAYNGFVVETLLATITDNDPGPGSSGVEIYLPTIYR